jgi:hypothetical protein
MPIKLSLIFGASGFSDLLLTFLAQTFSNRFVVHCCIADHYLGWFLRPTLLRDYLRG